MHGDKAKETKTIVQRCCKTHLCFLSKVARFFHKETKRTTNKCKTHKFTETLKKQLKTIKQKVIEQKHFKRSLMFL